MVTTLHRSLRALAVLAIAACGERPLDRHPVGVLELDVRTDLPGTEQIERIDHQVPHVSTVPATAGQTVYLNVRERRPANRDTRKAVLMIHGASVPAIPGFDLEREQYDWAVWLARSAGFDVFVLDFQGSGRSQRPGVMDDPCNVPTPDQQRALIPNPLRATCAPNYRSQLVDSASDWAELDTVVDHIRKLRGVDKVNLVAWSQGSFRAGPYSVKHPEKVESLFLYAPIFNPAFRSGLGPDGFGSPVALPAPGTPMSVRTKADLMGLWDAERRCDGQVEPGIQDAVWDAIMRNDDVGSTWGASPAGEPAGSAPEGVLRVRTPTLWGWNTGMAERITVPLLIIQGEFDGGGGGIQKLAELYQSVPSAKKLRFKVQCAGHFMVWESRRRVLHHISKEWITHGSVAGFESGEFFLDVADELLPL